MYNKSLLMKVVESTSGDYDVTLQADSTRKLKS
jgi:hypothetical protein